MSRGQGTRGFTLIELLLAVAIAFVVILGVVNLVTSSIRYELGMTSKGSAAGNLIISLNQFHKDIEDATVLFRPVPPVTVPTTDTIVVGCKNWSQVRNGPLGGPGSGGAINVNAAPEYSSGCGGGLNVLNFAYCVTPGANAPDLTPSSHVLWRHWTCSNVCNQLIVNCGVSGGANHEKVVGNPPGIWPMDSGGGQLPYYFRRLGDKSVEAHYIVGMTTPTVSKPIPSGYKVNVLIQTNIAFSNQVD